MADSSQMQKRGPFRSTWARARKTRPQLILSRRPRRRLRLRLLRWCGRRRLRRRLLQAQETGADWRAGTCLVSRAAAAPRPKTAAPSRAPSPALSGASDEEPAPSAPAPLPIPPLRPAGPGRALLLLPRDQGFTFSGICRVTCLYGQVQVLGFTIGQGQPSQDVFSTYTHSRLAINAARYSMPEKSKKEMKREARTLLRAHLKRDDRCWLMKNFSPLCSIVMLERLKTSTVNFITSHPGLSYVFLQESPTFQINTEYFALRSVGIRREKKKAGLRLTESVLAALEELVNVSCEEVDGCPVILVCGSQDVGKSTFNRYLINQLLNSIPCVDYLECDLGQTEFTPPGCISLLNITEPVLGATITSSITPVLRTQIRAGWTQALQYLAANLKTKCPAGPPFTHQRRPQKMVYFGRAACKNSCEHYIEAIKYVFSSCKRESPLIINTMGWVTDQGLSLLVDLIRLLSPSHVVQFSSVRCKPMPSLTPDYVDGVDGLYTRSKSKCRNRGFFLAEFAESLEFGDEEKESPVVFPGHKLICVQSDFVFRKTPRNRESHNRVLRDLAVLGYLGQLQKPVPRPLHPLHGLTPYQVPFSAVALRIIHSDVAPTHVLYAVNASWVALCKILDDVRGYADGPILLAQTPVCDCLGFGICRGVDVGKRLYHILTPLPPEELRNVNCLLVGAISIPQCIFKSQRGLEGAIPYITTDYNLRLPGASGEIGARETEETGKEKQHSKTRPRRKSD